MKTVLDAAFDLQAFVREQGWPFCFIGGLAVLRWGEERTTKDADMTVLTRFTMDEMCAAKLLERFAARFPNPMAFAQRTRFLPLRHESGIPMDVALGALDFEERSIQRASWWTVKGQKKLFTCSADDLVVHKAFAGRDRDWGDVEGIIAVQSGKLNIRQIFAELGPLAELKEDSGIIPKLEHMLKKRGLL